MKEFDYKIDIHINVWQRVSLSVQAETQEEADLKMIKLAQESPLSLDNGDETISIDGEEHLCETESLISSTAEAPTVEVYNADCESYETKNAIYTNLKKEPVLTINDEFRELDKMRENYNTKVRGLLFSLLKNTETPVVLADEDNEDDEIKDVVVACSGHSGAYNAKVLSVWLSGEDIRMKVQDVQGCSVSDIDEFDLEDDGLFFIIRRMVNMNG